MQTTVVTTTIYVPTFLKAYEENAKRFGQEVDFIVIGDRKTPAESAQICANIENCTYLSIEEQAPAFREFPELLSHLPENSIARRNLGHLLAYVRGAERVIMLDDDNLSISHQDFVNKHEIVGRCESIPMFESYNGWFNICDSLVEEHGVRFYARGFPPSKRWKDTEYHLQCRAGKVAVNAGLWINDPDIDALTRLERRLITTGMKKNWPKTFALAPSTWSPWNCQNTAISREALVSYFLSPHTGRHLDIWASYITTRIAEAQGQVIAFGEPLAYHDRSPHNLYKDLELELPWIRMTDEFCEALLKVPVPNTGYLDGLGAVIEGLQSKWNTKEPVKEQYLEGLKIWHNVFARLGA